MRNRYLVLTVATLLVLLGAVLQYWDRTGAKEVAPSPIYVEGDEVYTSEEFAEKSFKALDVTFFAEEDDTEETKVPEVVAETLESLKSTKQPVKVVAEIETPATVEEVPSLPETSGDEEKPRKKQVHLAPPPPPEKLYRMVPMDAMLYVATDGSGYGFVYDYLYMKVIECEVSYSDEENWAVTSSRERPMTIQDIEDTVYLDYEWINLGSSFCESYRYAIENLNPVSGTTDGEDSYS